jgi:phosphatidylserine/phosphatidylglycerophosphate/cardiolipin synthase-like enzyme
MPPGSAVNTVRKRYKFPWRQGNRFQILVDSTAYIPRMLAAIDAACDYVLLEMYLVESGAVADRFIQALLQAAERGVQTYLLLDDYGAQRLSQRDRQRLAQPNIHSVYYNPLSSYNTLYNLYRIIWQRISHGLHRNHRKLLLVDGRVAFAGGTAVTDEVDSPRAPERRWRETMVEIQGPILCDWQQLFTESWNRYADKPLTLPALLQTVLANGQPGRVTVHEAHSRMSIQRSLLRQLRRARQRVWFATAYFIPTWSVRRKLKRAARAGADVRLLLPGPITDHPGVRYASHRYYGRLLGNGIRIYEYLPRFFHAKTVLVDDWVSIGSCNFDRWNLRWNLEANQEIDDPVLAATVAAMFDSDFASSHEYTLEEWKQRSWRLRALTWFWGHVELLSLKIRHRRRS